MCVSFVEDLALLEAFVISAFSIYAYKILNIFIDKDNVLSSYFGHRQW